MRFWRIPLVPLPTRTWYVTCGPHIALANSPQLVFARRGSEVIHTVKRIDGVGALEEASAKYNSL